MVQPPICPEHKDIQVALTKSAEEPGNFGEVCCLALLLDGFPSEKANEA